MTLWHVTLPCLNHPLILLACLFLNNRNVQIHHSVILNDQKWHNRIRVNRIHVACPYIATILLQFYIPHSIVVYLLFLHHQLQHVLSTHPMHPQILNMSVRKISSKPIKIIHFPQCSLCCYFLILDHWDLHTLDTIHNPHVVDAVSSIVAALDDDVSLHQLHDQDEFTKLNHLVHTIFKITLNLLTYQSLVVDPHFVSD